MAFPKKPRRGACYATVVLSCMAAIMAFFWSQAVPIDPGRTFAPLVMHSRSSATTSSRRSSEPVHNNHHIADHVPAPTLRTVVTTQKELEAELPFREHSVAFVTLITSVPKAPNGIALSLDGAFVLRHSILRTLPAPRVTTARKRVGLEAYSATSRHATDGVHEEDVEVTSIRLQPSSLNDGDGTTTSNMGSPTNLHVDIRFVALVTPDVPTHVHGTIRAMGYEVWLAHSPINVSEIRNEQIRNETVIDGAMGIAELTKLEGLRMDMFDTVFMLDCDVMFHRPFYSDPSRFDCTDIQPVDRVKNTYRTTGGLLTLNAVLGWTKGGWAAERINGGFLVFSPRSPLAIVHLDRMVELLREGDFRPGTGWKGRGIGWTYGGRTVQGILPYYFFIEADHIADNHNRRRLMLLEMQKQSNGSISNVSTTTTANHARSHIEISRCRHNNMVQLPPCKVIEFSNVTSNHFTGDCVKPWSCYKRQHPLCGQFVDRWLETYRWALLNDQRVRHIVASSQELSLFAMSKWDMQSGGVCPGRGHFVSLAERFLLSR